MSTAKLIVELVEEVKGLRAEVAAISKKLDHVEASTIETFNVRVVEILQRVDSFSLICNPKETVVEEPPKPKTRKSTNVNILVRRAAKMDMNLLRDILGKELFKSLEDRARNNPKASEKESYIIISEEIWKHVKTTRTKDGDRLYNELKNKLCPIHGKK